MGKIVKYCSSCDEGFAERFGFCPDCGATLQAFEMNPLENEAVVEEQPVEAAYVEPTPVEEVDATPFEVEPEVPAPAFLQADDEEEFEDYEEVDEPNEATVSSVAAAPVFYQTPSVYADRPRQSRSVDESTNWD